MGKISVYMTIKEGNGKHVITLDRLKNISVNNAIEILQIKYSQKGLFKRICKGFNILAKDLDKILYGKNG